jgi:2-polyprenyl-3-methyl-5-hydroxy-6-metoxy-1,4-benzoquinol methylase
MKPKMKLEEGRADAMTSTMAISSVGVAGQEHFPSRDAFNKVCRSGLSLIRPLLEDQARTADSYGWKYGAAQAPSYPAYGRLRALLTLNAALALKPKRVLEIAAGDASLCASLEDLTGCEVVANDLRRENLETSVERFRNGDRIRLLPGNVFDLDPAATGKFDLVVACEIIEHVADATGLLRQLRRFLAPGGHILLTTPNGAYFRNKLPTHSEIKDFKELETRQFKPDSDGHLFLITPGEMCGLAREAGLKVENILLWGTPFITGESRFRMLQPLPLPYYRLELLCQKLGEPMKERFSNAMMVTLS